MMANTLAVSPKFTATDCAPTLSFQPEVLAIEHPVASSSGANTVTSLDPLAPQRRDSLARAARHDILRRLALPLRHDMVVHLQSLGMVTEALSARLDRAVVAPEDLQGMVSKLNRLSRQAVATCVEVSSWMKPSEDDAINLRDGVAECVRLLSTSLNFRGFQLGTELGDGAFEVSRYALRFLLPAAIFTLADAATAAGDLTIRTELSSTHGVVCVEYSRRQDEGLAQLHEPDEPPLAWTEVQALAAEESVELRRSEQAIILRLPRAVVTTPLKMAPV
ncbi:MAG: hypothetical protein ABW200_08990 [Hyphomicrobiaceae bacterium]